MIVSILQIRAITFSQVLKLLHHRLTIERNQLLFERDYMGYFYWCVQCKLAADRDSAETVDNVQGWLGQTYEASKALSACAWADEIDESLNCEFIPKADGVILRQIRRINVNGDMVVVSRGVMTSVSYIVDSW
jgi:hypothetical protein